MISQNRYVKIVSGVGAGANAAQRKLIMRAITQSTLVPPGIVLEFSELDAVGTYFGYDSEEYKRAKRYLGFISKNTVSPSSISFARWVSVAIAPMVVGDSFPKSLSSFAAVTAGLLQINVGNAPIQITGIKLDDATSLTNVASVIQTAVRTSTDPQLANATVTFNTNTSQFVLAGSVVGSGVITVAATGLPGDISQLTGLATGNAVLVAGQAADTAEAAVAKSAGISNNFGSFIFAVPYATMEIEDIKEVASWNHAQNNMYIYSVPAYLSDLANYFQELKGFSGCGLSVLSNTAPNDYIEQAPCEILAATDYSTVGATQNYMFYQFDGSNVTVSDDTIADIVDKSRGNYMGVTQSAGQQLAFYQRGVLCGGPTAAVDMNVYANEMWFKSACSAAVLTLFLASGEVPADETGAAMILGVLQPVIKLAGDNGTFRPGKPLTAVQQQYITRISGDKNAWRQVFSIGYWINISFSSYVNQNNGLTEWKATYKVIYAKGDSIRFVEGTDTMI